MTPKERISLANGIWMCQSHARLIDVDPLSFTTAKLLRWKLTAEARARSRLEGVADRAPDRSEDVQRADLWALFDAVSSLHVDLMRLFVVRFGPDTAAVNAGRLDEFREMTNDQLRVVDQHVSSITPKLPAELSAEVISIRSNLGKSLLALKRSSVHPPSVRTLLVNLRSLATRIAALLASADPALYTQIESEIEACVAAASDLPGRTNLADRIAVERFLAQEAYLRREPEIRTIADDFDQKLRIPYFLIDARILGDLELR